MNDILSKYGKYVSVAVTVVGFLFSIYVRFLIDERETQILKERLDKKIEVIKDHEKRLRKLECR